MSTDCDEHPDFERIVDIVTNEGIKDAELRSKLTKAIPQDVDQQASFAKAARIMLAIVFASGVTKCRRSRTTLPFYYYSTTFKAAANNGDAEDLVAALAEYYGITGIRGDLSAKYTEHIVAGKNPVQSFGLALEDIGRGSSQDDVQIFIDKPEKSNVVFGCTFEDDEYHYSKDFMHHPPKEKKHMKFKNEEQFQRFNRSLINICSSVMKDTVYNDVDQLIR